MIRILFLYLIFTIDSFLSMILICSYVVLFGMWTNGIQSQPNVSTIKTGKNIYKIKEV